MKGKTRHNDILAAPVEEALQGRRHATYPEYPVGSDRRPRSVDLASRIDGRLLLFEFEPTAGRIRSDVDKAEQIVAEILTIVVRTVRIRSRMQAALARLGYGRGGQPRIQVLTLGATLHWIANGCPALPGRAAARSRNRTIQIIATTRKGEPS